MSSAPPALTFSGCLQGARIVLPTLPGVAAFAIAFGAGSVQKGLTVWESVAASFFVTAGTAQLLSLELWRDHWTFGSLLTIAAVTATVNARFILMGASLQPWLRGISVPVQAASLFLLFEASWLAAEKHRAQGGRDVGVFIGAGIVSWLAWTAATVPGYWIGTLVADPKRFGLDLVLPCFLASLAVVLWRGPRRSGVPWAIAAVVAFLTQTLVPGYVFIVAGSIAGAVAGAVMRERV
ncbi:AzlC family ABC transporter permease [Enterovirga rhinocerotis]|uniref:Putative branched-subunit amino acid permease n=1 Tax=Enterovirga rhinocerotis TaxID=1339210 RepID=A0A4R7BN84_9HYPH|nr:AzlC family ABC transporter permease [Enterovirga rhinocerotis]TDR85386.1 putative branched-subunit amino acid permease [Enterovirga rhinocerotis]